MAPLFRLGHGFQFANFKRHYSRGYGKELLSWIWKESPGFTLQSTLNAPANTILVGGIPAALKNIKVNWDYYFQYMEIHKIHVTNHQPDHSNTMADLPS